MPHYFTKINKGGFTYTPISHSPQLYTFIFTSMVFKESDCVRVFTFCEYVAFAQTYDVTDGFDNVHCPIVTFALTYPNLYPHALIFTLTPLNP